MLYPAAHRGDCSFMKYFPAFRLRFLLGISAALILTTGVSAQKQSSSDNPPNETVAKPLTKKQLAHKQKALEKELAGPWKKWMNEDVVYIITDEEKTAFKRL